MQNKSNSNHQDKAINAIKAAIERKRIVEDYMRSGRALSELEKQGFGFWRIPDIG